MSAAAQVIERFQLTFILHLATTMPAGWCVKGGVNIRAFYASPRSSKDIDFDAFIPHDRLSERVTKILRSGPFKGDLRRTEIELVDLHPVEELRDDCALEAGATASRPDDSTHQTRVLAARRRRK